MTNYLFDTNIVSYFISGKHQMLNTKILNIPPENRFINWVIQEELLYGVFRKNRMDLEVKYKKFFTVCNIIQSDFEIVEICSKLESVLDSQGLSNTLEDIWIASTCLTKNLTLVTNNTKHFMNIPNLKLENWVK